MPKVHLLTTNYFSEILSGIGFTLGQKDYGLLLLFQSSTEPKDYVQLFQTQKVDGCIILGAKETPGELEQLKKLHERHFPYCLVNQTYANLPFHSIDAMHYEGSFDAVTLLIQKGFKRIAFLNGPIRFSNSSERLSGYQDALKKSGLKLTSDLIFEGNYSRTSGLKAAKEIAAKMDQIDAIFTANDRMAIGLMQGLVEYGFHAGKDYGIIGYDDSDIATMTIPKLSSVKVPLFDLGQIAAEKVLEMLEKPPTEQLRVRLPVTIMERESVRTILK